MISEESKNWHNTARRDKDFELVGCSHLRGLHEARKRAGNIRAKRLERRANSAKSYMHTETKLGQFTVFTHGRQMWLGELASARKLRMEELDYDSERRTESSSYR